MAARNCPFKVIIIEIVVTGGRVWILRNMTHRRTKDIAVDVRKLALEPETW